MLLIDGVSMFIFLVDMVITGVISTSVVLVVVCFTNMARLCNCFPIEGIAIDLHFLVLVRGVLEFVFFGDAAHASVCILLHVHCESMLPHHTTSWQQHVFVSGWRVSV